jgi:hypothetical protein
MGQYIMETACIVKKNIGLKKGEKIIKISSGNGAGRVGLVRSLSKSRSSSLNRGGNLSQTVSKRKGHDNLYYTFDRTYETFEQLGNQEGHIVQRVLQTPPGKSDRGEQLHLLSLELHYGQGL